MQRMSRAICRQLAVVDALDESIAADVRYFAAPQAIARLYSYADHRRVHQRTLADLVQALHANLSALQRIDQAIHTLHTALASAAPQAGDIYQAAALARPTTWLSAQPPQPMRPRYKPTGWPPGSS